jgi:hypothetical protein
MAGERPCPTGITINTVTSSCIKPGSWGVKLYRRPFWPVMQSFLWVDCYGVGVSCVYEINRLDSISKFVKFHLPGIIYEDSKLYHHRGIKLSARYMIFMLDTSERVLYLWSTIDSPSLRGYKNNKLNTLSSLYDY